MAQKTVTEITMLTKSIKKYYAKLIAVGIPVEQMILFGSHAKGSAKKWSDIDLCIVSKSFGKKPFDEMVQLSRYTKDIDDNIEPHPFHPNDLLDKYDPLAAEIRTHGITII